MLAMILNVFFYHLGSYFVPYCSGKVSVFPELPSPKLFFDLRMFLKYFTCTDALHHSYHFRYTISWWKTQEYVHMIFGYLKNFYFKIMFVCYLSKYLFCEFSDFSSQYPFAVFWRPYQMILCVVYCMACSLYSHALLYTIAGSAFGRKTFHPRLQNGVFKFCFS